ncbi:BUD31 Pre-mRNA-splicing factor BUD31 [Candida maltosa Xu316]
MAKTKKPKKTDPPPEGYAKIEPTLTKYRDKLKTAQTKPDPTKSKQSSLWIIYQLNYKISRYVYDMFKTKRISRDLYDWLLLQSYVNRDLIAKWKKPGYEKLCCVSCITVTNGGGTCVCRVPKARLLEKDPEKVDIECITCGCRGCASSD